MLNMYLPTLYHKIAANVINTTRSEAIRNNVVVLPRLYILRMYQDDLI